MEQCKNLEIFIEIACQKSNYLIESLDTVGFKFSRLQFLSFSLSLSQCEWEVGVNDIIFCVLKYFDNMVLKQLLFFSFRHLTND